MRTLAEVEKAIAFLKIAQRIYTRFDKNRNRYCQKRYQS